jgi:hypothetical protein
LLFKKFMLRCFATIVSKYRTSQLLGRGSFLLKEVNCNADVGSAVLFDLSDTLLLAAQTGSVVHTLGKDGEEAPRRDRFGAYRVSTPRELFVERAPVASILYRMRMGTTTSRILGITSA